MKILPNPCSSTSPKAGQQVAQATQAVYWSLAPEQLLSALHASKNGLQPSDAEQRLKQYGLNTIRAQHALTGEYVGLHWDYHRTAVPAVHLGVWFCPFARTAHADYARADGALRPGR